MCGIIGMVGVSAVNQRIYDALTVLQHRGQDAAGIMTSENGELFMRKDSGLVRDVFQQKHMLKLKGNVGIGQPVDRRVRQRAVDPGLQIKGQQLLNIRGGIRGHGAMSPAFFQSRPDRAATKRLRAHFHGCSHAKNRKQTPLGDL